MEVLEERKNETKSVDDNLFIINKKELEDAEVTWFAPNAQTLMAIKYGENKDKIFPMLTMSKRNPQMMEYVKNNIEKILRTASPKTNMETIYEMVETCYLNDVVIQVTQQFEDFIQEKNNKLAVIIKSNYYDTSTGDFSIVDYNDKLRGMLEKRKNEILLTNYLKDLKDNDPENYRKYMIGKENFEVVMKINSVKYNSDILDKIEGFEKSSIIERMKSSEDGTYSKFLTAQLYGLFLEQQEESLKDVKGYEFKTKIDVNKASKIANGEKIDENEPTSIYQRDEIKMIPVEKMLENEELKNFIFKSGPMPQGDEARKFMNYLDNFEISDEYSDVYLKSLNPLYQTLDIMKGEYYRTNEKNIKIYCDINKKYGVEGFENIDEQLEQLETQAGQQVEKKEDTGIEPGD